MRKLNKILILIIMVIALSSFASAALLSYYECEDNTLDTLEFNNGTNNNVAFSTNVPSFNTTGSGGTKSCYFDSTSDEIDFGTNDWNLWGKNFTVTAWINTTDDASIIWSLAGRANLVIGTYDVGIGLCTNNGEVCLMSYNGSDWIGVDTEGDYSDNDWHLFGVTTDTNSIGVWIDGVLISSQSLTGGGGLPEDSGQDSVIGNTPAGSTDFLGYMDNIKVYDQVLNSTQMINEYNCGNATACASPPSIVNVAPTNNDHLNDVPIQMQFNVTDDGLVNCSLMLNGTNIQNYVNVNTTSNPDQYYNLTANETSYQWYVNCTDGTNPANSTTTTFVYDATNPDITWTYPVQANTTVHYRNLGNMTFNFTFDDTYLWGYNISVFYPNNTVYWNNYTTNLTTTQVNFSRKYNMSAEINGTYKVRIEVEDDHTARYINDYDYFITPQYIQYYTDTNYIKLEAVEGTVNINTEKLTDRYTFSFEWNSAKKEHEIVIFCDETLYYRGGLYEYPTFVCGKNWLDFVIDNLNPSDIEDIIVKRLDSHRFSVNVKTYDNKALLDFSSLGGLNSVIEWVSFVSKDNLPPVINTKTPAVQSFSAAINSTVSFSVTATDPEGASPIDYQWIFNNTQTVNLSPSWTWTVPNVTLGVYNMTVRINDTNDLSTNYTWYVNITNTSGTPTIFNVTLLPRPLAFSNQTLQGYCTAQDNDNENLTFEYLLYRNGSLLINATNVTYAPRNIQNSIFNFTSANTTTGEIYIMACRAFDGIEYTDYSNSSQVSIIIGLLNISFYDIDTGASLSGTNITVSLIGDDPRYNVTNTSNIYYGDLDSAGDYTITYEADGYRKGSYIISSFNNQLVELNLSMTKTNDTSLVLITVLDKFSKDAVVNSLVTVQRYKDSSWVTDQILKTDFNGQTEGYFIVSTVFYNFLVEYQGTNYFGVINSNTNKKNIYAEDVSNGIIIEIDTSPDSIIPTYQSTYDIVTSCRFQNLSNTTGRFIFFFDDTNSLQHDASLNVTMDGAINCTSSVTSESGTLYCNVSVGASDGIKTFFATGYIDNIPLDSCDGKVGIDIVRNFNWGIGGFILGLFIVLISFTLFAQVPAMSTMVGTGVFVMATVANLMFGNTGVTILIGLVFGGFLIAKITSKSGVNA